MLEAITDQVANKRTIKDAISEIADELLSSYPSDANKTKRQLVKELTSLNTQYRSLFSKKKNVQTDHLKKKRQEFDRSLSYQVPLQVKFLIAFESKSLKKSQMTEYFCSFRESTNFRTVNLILFRLMKEHFGEELHRQEISIGEPSKQSRTTSSMKNLNWMTRRGARSKQSKEGRRERTRISKSLSNGRGNCRSSAAISRRLWCREVSLRVLLSSWQVQ